MQWPEFIFDHYIKSRSKEDLKARAKTLFQFLKKEKI